MDFSTIDNYFVNIFIYTVPFLFVLTIVVFFHELGHFLIARLNKVDVESFSVGFGKKIYGYKDKMGTEWKICWIPLGGYVKFIDDADPASSKDNKQIIKNGFHNKSLKAKSAIVSAGPIANFILAILIFTIFYTFSGKPTILPVIEGLEQNGPAERGGIEVGDEVVEINGIKITQFMDISNIVRSNEDTTLNFQVLRDDKYLNLKIIPELKGFEGNETEIKAAFIGISGGRSPENISRNKLPVHLSVVQGAKDTYNIIHLSLAYIYRIVSGSESAEHLGGPIRIAQISGEIAKNGFYPLIHLTALLSVSIGLINLFPIPMLDGGHLIFYLIEAIRGRPMSDKSYELFHKIGLSFIIFLMFFALWNDLNFLNIF
tara:strand:+ start:18422 stop:19540 length:1119 start_codon:yes stop_codon:yes gene_type:complete